MLNPLLLFSYALLCLIWGSTWLVIRIGLADMPPLWSLSLRMVPALAFLGLLAAVRRTSFRSMRRQPARVLQIGLLTYPGSYCLVYWGEQHVTSGLAAVVFSSMPFFVAVFSWWLLPDERPSRTVVLGLVLAVAGMVGLYWDQITLGSSEKVWGLLAFTLSSLIAAFNTVTIRRWLSDVPAVALSVSTVGIGGLLIPLFALSGPPLAAAQFTGPALWSAAYLGVIGSGLSFVLYYHLLSRVRALTMSLITFITPIVALILGHFFDYEPFSTRTWAGIVLVLGGVLLATTEPLTRARRGAIRTASRRRHTGD